MKKIICGENVAYKETNNADTLFKSKERYIINGFADKYFNKVDSFVFSKECQDYAYTALNYKIFRGFTSCIVSKKGIIYETKKYQFYSILPLGFIKGKTLYAIMENTDKKEYLFFKENDITTYSTLYVLIGNRFKGETNNQDLVLFVEEKNKPYLIINEYKISLKENNIFPAMPEGIYVSEDKESYIIFLIRLGNNKIINKCIFNDKLIMFSELPLKGNLSILEQITKFGRYSFGNGIKFKFSSKGDWVLYINGIVYENGRISQQNFDDIEI